MKYFLTFANGIPGTGIAYDDTLPSGAVECTQEQYQAPSQWTISDGAIIAFVPTALQQLQSQAIAALDGGLTITSTSTPALNGTYACDDAHQARINRIQGFIAANSKFPNSLAALPWPDISGTVHEFPSTAEFTAFASAVADYVMALDAVIMGISTTLPPAQATIP